MSASTVGSREQLVGLFVVAGLFRLGIQLQRAAQSHGRVRQVHQGHRIVSDGHIRVGPALVADGVEEVGLMVVGQLGWLLGLRVLDPFSPLAIHLNLAAFTEQHAARRAMELGAAVAVVWIAFVPQTHFEDQLSAMANLAVTGPLERTGGRVGKLLVIIEYVFAADCRDGVGQSLDAQPPAA